MADETKRPDPDRLLEQLREEPRGRLKIFLGAVAGVGKTYAMLEEARRKQAEGVEVLAGWVETHGRAETQALLAGLPALPPGELAYRGHRLNEFALDAALARRPKLLLLDELAHTNVPGSRHEKRWQDAEELLAAGIDVYTTVNVQHLESVNDIVAQSTGVVVRETVPDRIFDRADEIELVDLTPDDLLQRLREGKVYVPEAARRAIESFFSKGNLIALRELALSRAVDRVDAQMRSFKTGAGIEQVWPLKERILVCVSASPSAPRVVRAAARMAAGLGAEWIVAHVERPRAPDRRQLAATLRMAEQLGAEIVTLPGESVSHEILTYARSRNVTKIVVGKPAGRWWRYRLLGSVVDELVRYSDEIDVYVIRGTEEGAGRGPLPAALRRQTPWRVYLWSVPVVAAATALALALMPWLELTNLAMVYLLGVVFVAVRFGRGPSIFASVLSVLAFDFVIVPPRFTFEVADTQYLVTFGVMLIVGIMVSTLAGRLRKQAEAARSRERRIVSLYRLTREFSQASGLENVARIAEDRIGELLGAEVWILLPGSTGDLEPAPGITSAFPLRPEEKGVARWVFDHRALAGRGTATLPSAQALYVPLVATERAVGVIGLFFEAGGEPLDPERVQFIEALADQTALVVERARLARQAREDELRAEAERFRDALLSSVSHDLRTPLGTITGGASSLADPASHLSEEARRDLAQSIWEEAERLNRLVANLLNMSRLASGAVALKRDWHPIDEVIGAALTRLERSLRGRPLAIEIPDDLPLVAIDDVLIEQVAVNLIENALKHTPSGTPIEIRARADGAELVVEVADRGPGLPAGAQERIFAKFYRPDEGERRGVGLGLAICRGFVEAHGGRIHAENREGGGAIFRVTLPLGEGPPPMREAEEETAE
jgi:two-component system, OmpR family, sensor histidine kinase KdpD